jgi:hypothetical protein
MADLVSLTAAKNLDSAPKEPSLNAKNIMSISNLDTIWPSLPTAE